MSFAPNALSNIEALIYGSDLTSIVGLKGIDLYPSEDHTSTVTKTTLPLEDGSNITDHAVIDPDKITLAGVVSNVSNLISDIPFVFGGVSIVNNTKARDGWSSLVALKEARQPLTVVTSLTVYSSMLITSLKASVNLKTGTNLYFTCDLEEVRFVGTATTQLPPSKLGPVVANKSSTVNGGERQSPEVQKSVAAKLVDYL